MFLWEMNKWKDIYSGKFIRTGLRLRCDKNVDSEVKRACKEFCVWLRKKYDFPIRVPIYLKSSKQIKAQDGEMVSAIFFGPYNKLLEPYIKVAAGDYQELLIECEKDNALAAYLHSIAHELSHYYQWINNLKLNEIDEEKQAAKCGSIIVRKYSETRESP